MVVVECFYDCINDYVFVKISFVKFYDICSWLFGEVKKLEMINY